MSGKWEVGPGQVAGFTVPPAEKTGRAAWGHHQSTQRLVGSWSQLQPSTGPRGASTFLSS